MQLVYCRSEQAAVPLGNLFTLPATHRGKNLRLNSCYHMNIKELNPPPAPHSVHLITSPLSLPLLSLYLFTSPSLSTSQNSVVTSPLCLYLSLYLFFSLSLSTSLSIQFQNSNELYWYDIHRYILPKLEYNEHGIEYSWDKFLMEPAIMNNKVLTLECCAPSRGRFPPAVRLGSCGYVALVTASHSHHSTRASKPLRTPCP